MPITDLASAAGQLGFEQVAGPFGGIIPGPGAQFPNSYPIAKQFVRTSTTTSKFGNGVTSLDDPTYLGFSLLFETDSPLFSGADGTKTTRESAVGYLERIGEATRAKYLRGFIKGIQSINKERSYYWQTVEGLGEAYNKASDMLDPYGGVKEGEGITIGCLEAIDLKISALFALYRLACFDVKYKRYILPRNLMHFNVSVSIQEIRKFKTVRNAITSLITNKVFGGGPATEASTSDFVNENTSQITFRFKDCVWDLNESGKVFESVTNAGGNEIAKTSMKWSYSFIEMENQFSGFDSALIDREQQKDGPLKFGEAFGEIAKNFAKQQLANAADGALSLAKRGASTIIGNLKFGNVYGVRNQVLSAIESPQNLIGALQGAALQEQATFGNNTTSRLGDNVLGEGIQPSNSLPGETIFSPVPSGPSLGTDNIFGR